MSLHTSVGHYSFPLVSWRVCVLVLVQFALYRFRCRYIRRFYCLLTWLACMLCLSRWNIGYRPLPPSSSVLCCRLPSSSSCTSILLPTFLSPDLFSTNSLVAVLSSFFLNVSKPVPFSSRFVFSPALVPDQFLSHNSLLAVLSGQRILLLGLGLYLYHGHLSLRLTEA